MSGRVSADTWRLTEAVTLCPLGEQVRTQYDFEPVELVDQI
jgi:hypothetical protein